MELEGGGDLNDDIGSVTTRIVADPPAGPAGDGGARWQLVDAFEAARSPASARPGQAAPFTSLDGDAAERIDHLLVSSHFVPGSTRSIGRVTTVQVFGDHLFERRRAAGGGVPLDAVIADFMAGAVEYLTPDNDEDHWDHIEGQGSLFHVSYSGVTMALIHGGQPDALVLAHEPTRKHMRGLPDYALPSLEALRDTALPLARIANPACEVVGVSVNTQHLTEEEALEYLAEVEKRMGLPAVDTFRHGAARLVDALLEL